MKLIPYEKFTLQTTSSPSDVRERLGEFVEPVKMFRWSYARNHKPFTGQVDDSGFEIRRIIHYRNSFLPIIRGQFEATNLGTTVHIKMGLHPFVAIFLGLWLTVWSMPISMMWVAGAIQSDVALIFLGFPIIFLMIVLGCFWYEVRRGRHILMQIIVDHVELEEFDRQNRKQNPRSRMIQVGLFVLIIIGQLAIWTFLLPPDQESPTTLTDCAENSAQSPYCNLSLQHQFEHPVATTLALSSNGQLLASGGLDKAIRVWDVNTGKLLHTFQSDSGEIRALAIAPNGQTIVSGSGDRMVRIWSLANNQPPLMLAGHTEEIRFIRISPDGATITSVGAHEVKRWDIATGKLQATLPEDGGDSIQIGPVTIERGSPNYVIQDVSPNGEMAIVEFYSGKIALWDLSLNQQRVELNERFDSFSKNLVAAEISPDGTLAVMQYSNSFRKYQTQLKAWDLATGNVLGTGQANFSRTGFVNVPMVLTGDRILGSTNEGLRVWNQFTTELEVIVDIEAMTALVASTDGQLVAGITGAGTAQHSQIKVLGQAGT